eukprot:jgi/Ulvmu1/2190/UM013_0036.1
MLRTSLQARHLTPAALGALVGPALTKVQRTAATAHGGQDMSVAITFLVHNYGPVFSEHGNLNPKSVGKQPLPSAPSRQGAGGMKKIADKRALAPRHSSNGSRMSLLKSVQSPGSQRQPAPLGKKQEYAALRLQQLHAAAIMNRAGSIEKQVHPPGSIYSSEKSYRHPSRGALSRLTSPGHNRSLRPDARNEDPKPAWKPPGKASKSSGRQRSTKGRHRHRRDMLFDSVQGHEAGSGHAFFGMKSERSSPPECSAQSRGLRDEHSVTSGTQTTGSFFSDDEEVESAIGLVVDTCHAAIHDMSSKAHGVPTAFDREQSCTERHRHPGSSSIQRLLSVGMPYAKHGETGNTSELAVHSTAAPQASASSVSLRMSHDPCGPCSPAEHPTERNAWTITAAAAAPERPAPDAPPYLSTAAQQDKRATRCTAAPQPVSPRLQHVVHHNAATPGASPLPSLPPGTGIGTPGLAPPASPMATDAQTPQPLAQLHPRSVANTTESSAAPIVPLPRAGAAGRRPVDTGLPDDPSRSLHAPAACAMDASRRARHRQTHPSGSTSQPLPGAPAISTHGNPSTGRCRDTIASGRAAHAGADKPGASARQDAAGSEGTAAGPPAPGRDSPASPELVRPHAPSNGLLSLAQQSNSPFLSMQSPSPARQVHRRSALNMFPGEQLLASGTAAAADSTSCPSRRSTDGPSAGMPVHAVANAAEQPLWEQHAARSVLPAEGHCPEQPGASVIESVESMPLAGIQRFPSGSGGTAAACLMAELRQRMPSASAAGRGRRNGVADDPSSPAPGRLEGGCAAAAAGLASAAAGSLAAAAASGTAAALPASTRGLPGSLVKSFSDATALLAQWQGPQDIGRMPDAAVLASKLAQHGQAPPAAGVQRGVAVARPGGVEVAVGPGSGRSSVTGGSDKPRVATGASAAPPSGSDRRSAGGGARPDRQSTGAAVPAAGASHPHGSNSGAATDPSAAWLQAPAETGAAERRAPGAASRHQHVQSGSSRPTSSQGAALPSSEGGTSVTAANMRACEVLSMAQLTESHATAGIADLQVHGAGAVGDFGEEARLSAADPLAGTASASSHAVSGTRQPLDSRQAQVSRQQHRYGDGGGDLGSQASDLSDSSASFATGMHSSGGTAPPSPEQETATSSSSPAVDDHPALPPVATPAHLQALTAMHSLSRHTHLLDTAVTASMEAPATVAPPVDLPAAASSAEEEVAMMLPQGVELDDLIRLAEIVTGPTEAGAGAGGPTSPTELVRLVKEMMPKGAELAAAMEQHAEGTGVGAAPAVPGTSDPTANARQKAAVLAAALKGLHTPAATPAAPALVAAVLPALLPNGVGPAAAPAKPAALEAKAAPKPAPAPPPPPPPLPPKPASKAPPKPAPPPPPPPPPPKKAPPKAPPPPPPPPKKGTPKAGVGSPAPPPPPGMRLVQPSNAQQKRLKQLHWDAVRHADGMVWRELATSTELDVAELERLFKLLDNGAAKKVAKKVEEVHLVDSRRAHNICIELSGVHLDVVAIRTALTSMRTEHLSVDALGVLQRAVPTEHEAADIRLFLAGKHPRYKGMSDANALGACERYFMHVMDVPLLAERLGCVMYMRNFDGVASQIRSLLGMMDAAAAALRDNAAFKALLQTILAVGNQMNSGTTKGAAEGFKLALLLKLENIKATDRKTTLLQFCIQQAADRDPAILALPDTMAAVKRAARLQVTAVDTLLSELRSGIADAQEQVVRACASDVEQQAAGDGEDEGAEFFRTTMREFLQGAEARVAELQAAVSSTMASLRGLYDYFGEKYDGTEPVRILALLASFLDLYAKAVKQYQERKEREARAAKPKGGLKGRKGSAPKEAEQAQEQLTPEQAEARTKISVPTTGVRADHASRAAAPPSAARGPRARGVPPPPPPLPGSLRRPQSASGAGGGAKAGAPQPPPPPPPPPPRRPGAQPSFAADRDTSQSPLAYSAPQPPPPPPPLPPLPPGCARPLSGRSSDVALTPRLNTLTPSPTPRQTPASPSGHPPAAHAHAPPAPCPAQSHPHMCDVPVVEAGSDAAGSDAAEPPRPAPPPPPPPLPPRLDVAR